MLIGGFTSVVPPSCYALFRFVFPGHPNGCGTLVINNQTLELTGINDDDHDVCGTCEGCPTAIVQFKGSFDASAHAFEGQVASITYHPPPAASSSSSSVTDAAAALPDCPSIPSPWKAMPNKQISPGCSPSESRGSLGITATADECFAKVKAADSKYNYGVWRGDKDKSCDVCAFQWRGLVVYYIFLKKQQLRCSRAPECARGD